MGSLDSLIRNNFHYKGLWTVAFTFPKRTTADDEKQANVRPSLKVIITDVDLKDVVIRLKSWAENPRTLGSVGTASHLLYGACLIHQYRLGALLISCERARTGLLRIGQDVPGDGKKRSVWEISGGPANSYEPFPKIEIIRVKGKEYQVCSDAKALSEDPAFQDFQERLPRCSNLNRLNFAGITLNDELERIGRVDAYVIPEGDYLPSVTSDQLREFGGEPEGVSTNGILEQGEVPCLPALRYAAAILIPVAPANEDPMPNEGGVHLDEQLEAADPQDGDAAAEIDSGDPANDQAMRDEADDHLAAAHSPIVGGDARIVFAPANDPIENAGMADARMIDDAEEAGRAVPAGPAVTPMFTDAHHREQRHAAHADPLLDEDLFDEEAVDDDSVRYGRINFVHDDTDSPAVVRSGTHDSLPAALDTRIPRCLRRFRRSRRTRQEDARSCVLSEKTSVTYSWEEIKSQIHDYSDTVLSITDRRAENDKSGMRTAEQLLISSPDFRNKPLAKNPILNSLFERVKCQSRLESEAQDEEEILLPWDQTDEGKKQKEEVAAKRRRKENARLPAAINSHNDLGGPIVDSPLNNDDDMTGGGEVDNDPFDDPSDVVGNGGRASPKEEEEVEEARREAEDTFDDSFAGRGPVNLLDEQDPLIMDESRAVSEENSDSTSESREMTELDLLVGEVGKILAEANINYPTKTCAISSTDAHKIVIRAAHEGRTFAECIPRNANRATVARSFMELLVMSKRGEVVPSQAQTLTPIEGSVAMTISHGPIVLEKRQCGKFEAALESIKKDQKSEKKRRVEEERVGEEEGEEELLRRREEEEKKKEEAKKKRAEEKKMKELEKKKREEEERKKKEDEERNMSEEEKEKRRKDEAEKARNRRAQAEIHALMRASRNDDLFPNSMFSRR